MVFWLWTTSCLLKIRSSIKFIRFTATTSTLRFLKLQNLFHQLYRELSLNVNFVVLFRNYRGQNQIQVFLRQCFGTKANKVFETFINATTSEKYSYLLLNFRPKTSEKLRVRTNIFANELNYIYL